MPTKVIMPQLGESVVEGTVSRWLKQEGDTVAEYEPLLEVSTDKVDTEIPSPAAGVLNKIYVPAGQTVERGVLLALIGEAENIPANGNSAEAVPAVPVQNGAAEASTKEYGGFVSPVVARMAAEHHLDLSKITGTGREGRITKKDVEAYLSSGQSVAPEKEAAEAPPWERPGSGDLFKPTVDYGAPAAQPQPTAPTATSAPQRVHPVEPVPQGVPGELVHLTAMRKAIAEHMVRSKLHTSPHVTTVFEFDMSAVLKHREANKENFARQGVNLTLTAYFAAATVKALQANRYINAQWTDEGIYLHNTVNLAIAVALEDGLIVPVIKNAQDLNLLGTARAVNDMAARARSKQLRPEEVQGGTFTISNHGVSGSLFATPIINQPQAGILGIGVLEKRVKVINDAIAIRPCIYVTLTFDHRIADGAVGDGFMLTLKQAIENWM